MNPTLRLIALVFLGFIVGELFRGCPALAEDEWRIRDQMRDLTRELVRAEQRQADSLASIARSLEHCR